MSELAFDKEGEPIELHEDCEVLRVRRFRNPGMRGTCETVREDDGAPLYVSVDCSFLEFKRLVGGEAGFYRLDQCDVRRQPVPDAAPAYVSITEGQRNSAGSSSADSRDDVIRELARANADMCRTIAGQASDMMRAAAELMRAADGAGIPRRAPLPPLERDNDEDEDDDRDEDDVAEEQPNVWGLIEQMMPSIQMWLASMAAKRSSTPPPAATPPPAPVPVPAPAAAPSATPAAESVAAGPSSPTSSTTTVAPPPGPPADSAGPAPEQPRNAMVTPEQLTHLLSIRAQLAPREAAIAEAVVTKMTPEMRAQWLTELSALSVEQAVEVVRSMIPKPSPAPSAPAKDGT